VSSELFPRAWGFGPISTCSSQKIGKKTKINPTGVTCCPSPLLGKAAGQVPWDKSCSTQLCTVPRLTRTRAQTHCDSGRSLVPATGSFRNILTRQAGLTKPWSGTVPRCGPRQGRLRWGTLKCFAGTQTHACTHR